MLVAPFINPAFFERTKSEAIPRYRVRAHMCKSVDAEHLIGHWQFINYLLLPYMSSYTHVCIYGRRSQCSSALDIHVHPAAFVSSLLERYHPGYHLSTYCCGRDRLDLDRYCFNNSKPDCTPAWSPT